MSDYDYAHAHQFNSGSGIDDEWLVCPRCGIPCNREGRCDSCDADTPEETDPSDGERCMAEILSEVIMAKRHVDSVGMFIGTNEASVAAARKVIVEIATLSAPPEVRVEGIKALVELCKVQNVTVRDCHITTKAQR